MKKSFSSVILGAAFLMATSAVGPGFLTQTSLFTKQLAASFGFVILLSIILDIFAQLNIWRVLTVSERRAQDVANQTIPEAVICLPRSSRSAVLAFNIGNHRGRGFGFECAFRSQSGIRRNYQRNHRNNNFQFQRSRKSDGFFRQTARFRDARIDNLRRFRFASADWRSDLQNCLSRKN